MARTEVNVPVTGSGPAVRSAEIASSDRAAARRLLRAKNGVHALGLVALVTVAGLVGVHHGTDSMWDVRNYHLYDPFAGWYDRYSVDIAPAQLQSFFNPLIDDFPLFLITFFNDRPRVIALILGAIQGLNWYFVFLIASFCLKKDNAYQLHPCPFERGSRPIESASASRLDGAQIPLAATAVMIGATGAGTVPLIGSLTGDLLVSIPVLAAILCLLHAVEAGPPTSRRGVVLVALTGALGGIGVGAKPTVGPLLIGLGVALIAACRGRRLATTGGVFLLGSAAGATLTGAHHAARMIRLFANPVFPQLNGFFRSPYADPVSLRDVRFLPKSLWDVILFPFKWAKGGPYGVVSELSFRDFRICLAITLWLVVAVLYVWRRRQGMRWEWGLSRGVAALLVFAVASYLIWLPVFAIYRYFLVVEMLSGILIVSAISMLSRQHTLAFSALAFLALTASTRGLEWGHVPFGDKYIDVTAPPIAADSLVLIAGEDPVSYVIPFLDPSITWVAVANNLLVPGGDNLLVRKAHEMVSRHFGPLMILDAGSTPDGLQRVLDSYGLSVVPGQCGRIASNIDVAGHALCSALRSTGQG